MRKVKRVKSKRFLNYSGKVYDLSVDNTSSYTVNQVAVHNSSCGSLVCYLLDITAIDPLKYDLIFERFIDKTRTDLPDVDIDFSDQKRHMIFEYADAKYGKAHVSRLGTTNTFKPRNAIKGAGAALQIPQWKTEKVLDSLIVRSSGDSRALQALEDTLNDTEAGRKLKEEHPELMIAARMEGHPANAGQHAAGLIITKEPVLKYVAIDARNNCAMCDKYDAESLNLLKIDALGLTQLSIFERAAELAGISNPLRFFETLPLDDKAAFDILNKGHFSGVFQFMGGSLKNLTKQITVDNLEDIISITALARPGPMVSGGANSWVRRRTGKEIPVYPHPEFEKYLGKTYGIVIYQEQTMEIGRNIGGLSWDDVTALRKAMSKSLGKEYFDKFGDKFKIGARKYFNNEADLDKFWSDLCSMGSWSFNRSHAVAYGIVSYWCCWMKAHYPIEFAAASLDAQDDMMRQLQLLRELDEEGVKYTPIDPLRSIDKWTVANGRLIGPLTLVRGIGPKTVHKILDGRLKKGGLEPSLLKKLERAETPIDTLTPVMNKISKIHPDLTKVNIFSKPLYVKDAQCGVEGEVMVFAVAKKITPRDENEEINIAKRGYKIRNGPTASLNMFVVDDTDEIFCKIDRWKFESIGRKVSETGRPGKSLYAIKGTIPPDFRMIRVTMIRYLGELDA